MVRGRRILPATQRGIYTVLGRDYYDPSKAIWYYAIECQHCHTQRSVPVYSLGALSKSKRCASCIEKASLCPMQGTRRTEASPITKTSMLQMQE